MKSKRKYLLLFVTFALVISLSACKSNDIDKVENDIENEVEKVEEKLEKVDINVAGLKGATTIGLAKLVDEEETNDFDIDFEMYNMPEEIVAGLTKGEIDIAAVPANLASVLYNKTEGEIQVASVNTLGVLYIVENSDDIKDINDLEGKTIYTLGKGTTPEGVLNSFIKENNLENVNIEFKQEASEIAAILNKEENVIAMIPEPFVSVVSMKNENVRRVFDMADEWEKINNSPQVTGVLVARKEFIDNNKEVFDKFLEEYEKSINFANENVTEVSKIVEDFEIVPEGLGEKSIPNINMQYIDGSDMQEAVSKYLEKLYEFEPKLVGGKLPDEGFYYKK
ncbi:MAG TPA: MqnA/MqnD/SBP family protein [Tissierellaceae bacterium]